MIERHAVDVPHQGERPARQIRQRDLRNLSPVRPQLRARRHHGLDELGHDVVGQGEPRGRRRVRFCGFN